MFGRVLNTSLDLHPDLFSREVLNGSLGMYWLVKHSLHFLRIRRQEIIFFRNIGRALFSCNTRFEIRLFACLIAGEFWNIT